MKKQKTITPAIISVSLLLVLSLANVEIAFASRDGLKIQNTAGAAMRAQNDRESCQDSTLMELRLNALEKVMAARYNSIEQNIQSQKEYQGFTRELVNILIGAIVTILIGLLGIYGYIEQKVRKVIKTVNKQVLDAKKEIDNYMSTSMDQFQSKIKEASESLSNSRSVPDLLIAAKNMFLTSNYSKAIQILDIALSLNPEDPEARKYRGLCLKRVQGRLDEAIADIEKALDSDRFHNDSESYIELARAYLSVGKYDGALIAADLAERNGYPSREATQMVKADALKCMRKTDAAIDVYDQVISANPRCNMAVQHKAEILCERKAFDNAIDLLENAITHRGNVSKYHVFLGRAYAERNGTGDWEKALSQFEKAQEISGSDWDLWYYWGKAYFSKWKNSAGEESKNGGRQSLFNNALNCFLTGKKLAKKSDIPRFVNQISRLYLVSGQIDKAIDEAKSSVALNRSFVQNHLALCTALLAGKKWPDALSAAEEGLKNVRDPGGKIWCYYFSVLAKILQHYDVNSVLSAANDLLRTVEKAPSFDITGWDWAISETVIAEEISRLSDNNKKFLEDINAALNDPSSAASIRQKWENSDKRAG